jgi:large subunit ribosomal protein L3
MVDKTLRRGSLQFYPRKRARKILPSVNWNAVKSEKQGPGLLGFIGYKVGMINAYVKDNTEHSLTKNKKIVLPATILECPSLKIYSVRFYKNSKVVGELIVSFDNELKRKLKKPKQFKKIDDFSEDYDDVKVIVYSNVKLSGISKKKPDIIELGLSGSKEEKLKFIKEKIGKEINISSVFSEGLVDIRGVTKGHGTQGPVKRFGISLKAHKSEKGRRRPGSLGPWHPARVTFRAPQAGQTGFHSRVDYNKLILNIGKISEKDINKSKGFNRYGKIKTSYIVLKGSVPGAKKRQLLITPCIRSSKKQSKQNYEFLGLR